MMRPICETSMNVDKLQFVNLRGLDLLPQPVHGHLKLVQVAVSLVYARLVLLSLTCLHIER